MLVSGAAWSDVPRLDLSGGLWEHEASGTLSSNDPLLVVPDGFKLSTEREPYARFGVRLGNWWWAPVIRARYTALTTGGSSFVDNSTYVGNVLVNLNTTSTTTDLDLQHLEGLMYFTLGETLRAELGGGLKRFDGSIETVRVNNTSLNGEVTTRARRDLPASIRVYYGAAYAEPASWLTFGAEAVSGREAGTDVLDLTFRFIIKPLTWMGLEGGYRRMTLKAENHENTSYDFEFGGPYAGLSFLYGSKSAGLLQPDSDGDGVYDSEDSCPDTPEGAAVNESGCEPDTDGDGIPDRLDECPDTSGGAMVNAKGCASDSDGDGTPDGLDQCPNTPTGMPVDEHGCSLANDEDGDGLEDSRDRCPATPAGVAVDANGCAIGDADQDGVPDERDRCPGGAMGEVDENGCPLTASLAPVPLAAGEPDGDHDGVPDAIDRCPKTPRGFKVDGTGCLVTQESVLQGITFQVNSSYLMRDSEVLLLETVDALRAQPNMKVEIQGHTCDLGDAKYNQWLSQRRANRVLEFLVRHGIDAKRLTAKGYGESQPMVPNDDERMRELNRRTVFKVVE